MAVITYNPLLGIGDPVQAVLLAQATSAPVQSPFASQMTSSGLLPMSGIPAQATNLEAAAPVEVVEPTAPVVQRTVAPAPMADDTGMDAPAGSNLAVSDYQQGFAQTPEFFPDFENFIDNYQSPDGKIASAMTVADAYRDEVLGNRADAYKVGNIFEQPISQTMGQMFSNPNAAPGMLLGTGFGMGGGLLASGFLNAMDRMNTGNLAYDYAMSKMAQPDYSVGTIGGTPYSIGPGLFGLGRSLRGNVPFDITIDDIERIGKISRGINPFGDGGFVGGGMYGGPGGYTEDGGYVDGRGNYSAMGTMGALEDLADKFGVSTSDAKSALDQARAGESDLSDAMMGALEADMEESFGAYDDDTFDDFDL
tara:strand:+ start:558 stop:1652 length:1095 start_codon:yes stop_codon:yes gene_type:complete